jgi:addiction module RelE/StbE family toxin
VWEIYEHRRAARQLDSLPLDILKRYEKWKDVVRISGPQGLRKIRGFNDEPLHGEWKGHRSSRLNLQYRVIYRVDRVHVFVEVVDVTAHDYRRK